MFYFSDALVYLTVVQLLILVTLLQVLYKWTLKGLKIGNSRENSLRVIQGITFFFLTIAYFFQYAIVVGGYKEKRTNLFRVFGLENED